jgi:hypothetical protein
VTSSIFGDLPNPGLMIGGYRMLGLPITSRDVEAIIKHFTNGDESLLIEGCLVVSENTFHYANSAWPPALTRLGATLARHYS